MTTFNKTQDLISIIAPSSSCIDAELKLGQAKKILEEHGFRLLIDSNIFEGTKLPYLAASKEVRYNIFKNALLNRNVKIIWAFRGGYGCDEFLFDCLNIKPTSDKILIGFSDITSLHILFNQHYGMKTIHGTGITSFLPPMDQSLTDVLDLLSGKGVMINLIPINKSSNKKITGKTIGGNLSIFVTMLGTKLHPITKDKIIIIEDVNEAGYRIHRNLMHLKNAGIFNHVKAVILGDFTKSDDTMENSIAYFCEEHISEIPVFRATGIGHSQVNHPIIMDHEAVIKDNFLQMQSPFSLT